MNSLDFRTYLLAASYLATKAAQNFVKDKLAYEFRFDVELNQSVDEDFSGEFLTFPEDNGRILEQLNSDDVATLLSRDGKVPVWIDINVKSCAAGLTTLNLQCAGRYTDQMNKMYYNKKGLGPFGIKGPNLPPGWTEGKRFRLGK